MHMRQQRDRLDALHLHIQGLAPAAADMGSEMNEVSGENAMARDGLEEVRGSLDTLNLAIDDLKRSGNPTPQKTQ